MLKLAVLVSGGGTNLQALIDQIEQEKLKNVKIEVVISSNKSAYALERAKKHGIVVDTISRKDYADFDEFAEGFTDLLDKYPVDLIVLAGCLLIIPEKVVKKYRNRIINVHPSLIPAFCGDGFYGIKVHEEVLARGVKVTGATVHFVDEGTDTGPIILQKPVMVHCEDTPETLQKRVMEQAEWEILPRAVQLLADNKIVVDGNKVIINSDMD